VALAKRVEPPLSLAVFDALSQPRCFRTPVSAMGKQCDGLVHRERRGRGMVPVFSRCEKKNLRKVVRAEGLEPSRALRSTDFRTVHGFRRPGKRKSRPRFAVWTIPSPCPRKKGVRCCPSSLYTFPEAGPGLARDCHFTGFPEFGQFCIAGFPASTQGVTQVRCVCHSATPACSAIVGVIIRMRDPVCKVVSSAASGASRGCLYSPYRAAFEASSARTEQRCRSPLSVELMLAPS